MGYLQNMTPGALQTAIAEGQPLLIAVGTVEYHGSQLPLGTDLLFVEGLLREMEMRAPVVVAPSFVYSPNGYCVSGPEKGTVDISVDCFIRHTGEILAAYSRMGFRSIRVYIHHQCKEIRSMLEVAILKNGMYSQQNTLGEGWWTDGKTPDMPSIQVCDTVIGDAELCRAFGGHGGIGETQAILATNPELVKMDCLTNQEPWWNATAKDAQKAQADANFEKLVQLQLKQL